MKPLAKFQPLPCGMLDCTTAEVNAILAPLLRAETLPDIRAALDLFTRQCGVDITGQLLVPEAPGRQVCFYAHTDTLSAYTEEYIAQALPFDPISLAARRASAPVPFGLQSQRRQPCAYEKLAYSLLDNHGIRCGFIVPVRNGEGFSLFKVAFEREDRDLRQRLPSLATLAQFMAPHLHQAMCRVYGLSEAPTTVNLTPRERECLHWAAAGKTAWETSAILNLAETTVVFHLENAKRKLGSRTLPQAVAQALRLQSITI